MEMSHEPMVPVKPHIAQAAEISDMDRYRKIYRESLANTDAYWAEQAASLHWEKKWETVSAGGFENLDFTWFAGGRLNACHNAVDRHVDANGDKVALIWAADEPGSYRRITYRELLRDVCRIANVLKRCGVGRGDRVCLYMPMIPETAATMLACARIGAVHSVVFAGFSADALRDRIQDAHCRVVVTANEGMRGGRAIPLKKIVDEAVSGLDFVDTVLVARRTEADVPMSDSRDIWLEEACAQESDDCPVEWMESEDPLFILYTSGSTGLPKGVLHTTGGYMVYAALTHRLIFDLKPDDIYCCAADVGWITGHTYIVYGPLANGATSVMFESTPLYPDASRYWQMVDDLGITIFYTAPTALRAIAQRGDEWVSRASRTTLRILGTVGEPINPETWRWYHDVVGDGRCAVVDTWWQTETGGILITPLPGATPAKPGSATFPFFGIEPVLMDEEGHRLTGNGVSGALCLARSWPGQARTLWGDHERFQETYFSQYPGLYFTGDGCKRDEDGYYWITGRIDDVLNVSGHRLGTAEVESALVAHEAVAEAAVVGYPHAIKGTGIYAYVTLSAAHAHDDPQAVMSALRDKVREVIGPFAAPDKVHLAVGLPKTRSGKIMRRILRKIAAAEYDGLGDTSTLAEPAVVDRLIREHRQRRDSEG
ncbi:MAG: acetate--CoA ligase [Acidobacteria bacterium]|nr:MAG: acetate--CoA ligase [Acidobacteriota bacterium]